MCTTDKQDFNESQIWLVPFLSQVIVGLLSGRGTWVDNMFSNTALNENKAK